MAKAETSKKSHAGRNVLVFFVVFIILEMLIIFGIGKVFKNPDVTPSIAGYSLYMTKSELKMKDDNGNMVTAVPKDVLIIAANGVTDARSKIGNAVLCEKVPGVESGVFWLVSVEAKENQDGVFYRVWDSYNYYDLRSSNVVGFTGSYFETAGKVIKFVTNKFGMIVCAVVPVFLLVLLELIIAIATHSPEEYEEDEDYEEPVRRPREKEVKLDDFLYGGQSEGEQIARHRREQTERFSTVSGETPREPDTHRMEPVVPQRMSLDNTAPVPVPAEDSKPDMRLELTAELPKAAEETAPSGSLTLADDDTMTGLFEKGDKLVEGEDKPAGAPDLTLPKRSAPVRRRPVRTARAPRTGGGSDMSLEDLSKMIEEQQAKLKGKTE